MKILIAILSMTSLHALYMGDPAEPLLLDAGFFIPTESIVSLKAGYQGDVVWNRSLKASGQPFDRFEILMNQGVITLGFIDRLELYGSVGSFSAEFWNHSSNMMVKYQTETSLTAGGGVRIVLTQWDNTTLGIDGKYQYAAPDIDWTTVHGFLVENNADLSYQEWQVGLGLSHTIDIFTPYIGATYANVHANLKHEGASLPYLKAVNRHKFGMALGCSLSSGRKVDLNIEVRLFDEQATIISGNIKF